MKKKQTRHKKKVTTNWSGNQAEATKYFLISLYKLIWF